MIGHRLATLILLATTLLACGQTTGIASPSVPSAGPALTPAAGGLPSEAPADPMAATIAAGLQPETHETLIHHVHAHLDVFVNGRRSFGARCPKSSMLG